MAVVTSKNVIVPSKVATATSKPSGLIAQHVASAFSFNVSAAEAESRNRQIFNVPSQEHEARSGSPDADGDTQTEETGASWPARTSSRRPVLTDQT